MTADRRRDGLGWAYAGVVLGGGVSVAANVAHSFVPPAGVPSDWHPAAGAVLSAVFWPVALFVAIEILSRTAWPAGIGWGMIRFGGLLPVAVVAAVVSYRHLSGLLRHYGEDGLTATFGPLAVDGLMAVASAALLGASPSRTRTVAEEATPPRGSAPPVVEDATPRSEPTPDVAPTEEPAARPASPAEATASASPAGDDVPPPAERTQIEEARAFVRVELAAGRSPSGAAVGRHFGRNSRWGQRIVREVSAAISAPADAGEDPPSADPQSLEGSHQSRRALKHALTINGPDLAAEPSSESLSTRSTGPRAEVHTKALQSDGPPAANGERAGRSA